MVQDKIKNSISPYDSVKSPVIQFRNSRSQQFYTNAPVMNPCTDNS